VTSNQPINARAVMLALYSKGFYKPVNGVL